MRDLQYYADICRIELQQLKIRTAANIAFKINTRAKTRLGICKKKGDFYTIEIAAALLDDSSPEALLQETLHHELLHTCYGCMKHTGRWKQLAERVNTAYGYHITRLADVDSLPSSPSQQPRYRLVCPHCGTIYERFRRSALIQHPERYRCGKCGGRLLLSEKADK